MTRHPTRGGAIDGRTAPARRPIARARIDSVWSALLAHPWRWLAGWSALLVVVQVTTDPRWFWSWFYIVRGVHVLLGPDALSLYANHPELQMGPLTFLLSTPLVLLPPSMGPAAAAFLMQAAGLLALREVRAMLHPADPIGDRRWFVSAVLTMPAWTLLAVLYGHPDDVLALLGAVIGLRLLRSGATVRAALLFGLAIDCKPWIAPIALVLLSAPRRRWVVAGAVVAIVVAVVWTPFLLQPGSLRATGFTIAVDPTSTIRLLGIAGARTPAWCRPAQLVLGSLLVAIAALRGRPRAALLLVVVVRLLLDPSTHLYYDAGAVLGACLLDTTAALPIATVVALVGVQLASELLPSSLGGQAVLRLAALLLLGLLALAGPVRRSAAPPSAPVGRPAAPSTVVLSG